MYLVEYDILCDMCAVLKVYKNNMNINLQTDSVIFIRQLH